MKRCIFCLSSGQFTTREHILPVALGGGDWAILPNGLFCDSCQSKFGSEIEQQALNDYPFSLLRVFLGIPRRKPEPPWFNSWEGTIRASMHPGRFMYEPTPPFRSATFDGSKTQLRLLAHSQKPRMICRFLIKMGIEVVASDNGNDIFQPKFDAARRFALTGLKDNPWWYVQHERMNEALRYFTKGLSLLEWTRNVKLEVIKLDQEREIFHLSVLYLSMFTPLTLGIDPKFNDSEEPECRLFRL